MKLTAEQIDAVEEQTGSRPIPDNLPVMNDLLTVFGEHTFYFHPGGVLIWEVAQMMEGGGVQLRGVRVASWADDAKTELVQHEPLDTGDRAEIGHFGRSPAA